MLIDTRSERSEWSGDSAKSIHVTSCGVHVKAGLSLLRQGLMCKIWLRPQQRHLKTGPIFVQPSFRRGRSKGENRFRQLEVQDTVNSMFHGSQIKYTLYPPAEASIKYEFIEVVSEPYLLGGGDSAGLVEAKEGFHVFLIHLRKLF